MAEIEIGTPADGAIGAIVGLAVGDALGAPVESLGWEVRQQP